MVLSIVGSYRKLFIYRVLLGTMDEIFYRGKIVHCGERTVQQKQRIALSDILQKHDVKVGEYVNVLLFFPADNEEYEKRMDDRKAHIEMRMNGWIKTCYEHLANIEKCNKIVDNLKRGKSLSYGEIQTLSLVLSIAASGIAAQGGFLKNIRDFLSQYEGSHEMFDLADDIFTFREIQTGKDDFSYALTHKEPK
jgi:hypothetical protein